MLDWLLAKASELGVRRSMFSERKKQKRPAWNFQAGRFEFN
jgi:hypothetical protein